MHKHATYEQHQCTKSHLPLSMSRRQNPCSSTETSFWSSAFTESTAPGKPLENETNAVIPFITSFQNILLKFHTKLSWLHKLLTYLTATYQLTVLWFSLHIPHLHSSLQLMSTYLSVPVCHCTTWVLNMNPIQAQSVLLPCFWVVIHFSNKKTMKMTSL